MEEVKGASNERNNNAETGDVKEQSNNAETGAKKKSRLFGRSKNRILKKVTGIIDGINKDYSERNRTRKALIALIRFKTPVLIILLAALILAGGYFLWDSQNTASAKMSLNYEESAYGLNPNSTRFYVYDIKDPEVVRGMLKYSGVDPDSVDLDEVTNCISVRTTNTKAISESTTQDESYFISTTYRITLKRPSQIKDVDVHVLLDFLCKSYKDYFYSKYTENRSILEFDIGQFDDREYMVIADLFDMKAQQIEKYLNTRVKQSKSFTEQESDETFKSLVEKVEDIRNYDIENYRSFVKEAGCSHDKTTYIRSLEYTNRMNNIDYSKDMAAYEVNNEGIKIYNDSLINIVLIPSVDSQKNTYYMSRTKTGMDYMAKAADDHLLSAQEIAKKVKQNNEIISKMSSGTNQRPDINKANSMIGNISKKFTELSKQVEQVDKAYVKYRTKDYLTFKTTNASLSQRVQPVKLFVIAAGLLFVIFAAIWLRLKYISTRGNKE